MEMQHFDIAIIGAGPAGCSAALTLQDSALSIAVFEKSTFPRQKICGDGLCDRTINTLKAIKESYLEEFLAKHNPLCIKQTKLTYKGRSYLVDFKNFGYISKRVDFDNFLFSLVTRDCKNTTIFEQCTIQSATKDDQGFVLQDDEGNNYHAKIILVCNGASSKIARTLTNEKPNENMGVAVRAYYKNVQGIEANTMELHYKKEFFPGYLWIFPIADGTANVGFGCKTENPICESESYRDIMENWINNDEELRKRFSESERITPIQGGLIPYNNGTFSCVGDNFCICGDAAHLIDPISGGGIGSAMLSGRFAAQQAEICIKNGNSSKESLLGYEITLRKRVEKEMTTRANIQKAISNHPWLLDILAFFGRQAWIFNKIKNWYL